MFDLIKKTLLTGVGLAVMTKDKVEELGIAPAGAAIGDLFAYLVGATKAWRDGSGMERIRRLSYSKYASSIARFSSRVAGAVGRRDSLLHH